MDNIASPSQVLSRVSECMRRLFEAGLTFDDLQKPIDRPDFRQQLVEFWSAKRLLCPVGTLTIPALPQFSVAARLADTTKPKIFPGNKFKEMFLGSIESETPETLVRVDNLEEQSRGDAIIVEAGGEQAAEVAISQVFWLIDNDMLEKKNSKWYLFFVRSQKDGKLWAVFCYWRSAFSRWDLGALPLSDGWNPGYRIVSRVPS